MTASQFGDRAILCSRCGHDLRATALGGSCPECGLSVQAVRLGARVEGRRLIVQTGVVLPRRCVGTNAPVEQPGIHKTFRWAHPAWGLLILATVVLVVLYPFIRKECRITYFMSRSERLRIWLGTGVSQLVFIAAVVALIVGIVEPRMALMLPAVVGLLGGAVMMRGFANPIRVVKAQNGEFWIKGCGKDFLESIRAETDLPSPEFNDAK